MTTIKGVYKRNNNRWEARYKKGVDEKGHTVYGSVYGKTKEEVTDWFNIEVWDKQAEFAGEWIKKYPYR